MLKVFNSLGRELQNFEPINKDEVRIYTCGPTVYNYVSIGNWRTYTLGDIAVRTLHYLGYKTKYVMNITDVGHLTGDNLGDADTGEDRLEKAAKAERKTAWEVAEAYTIDFLTGFTALNLEEPFVFSKATDHINEQIELIQQIEKKGFAYKISDGIYFDTKAYEAAGNIYGELSNLDLIKEGARVEINPEKKDPRDFALWKFSPTDAKRDMEWESPWGVGFPGWHIECSAMSMKYLGDQLDIHIGGEDLKSTHHPNEIAQSESATGKIPFSKYWLHGAFLLVDGGRMGKSLGNAYNLTDIRNKGFYPLDLRYFYLTTHYRKQQNFTWEALESSKTALERLRNYVSTWARDVGDDRSKIFDIDSEFKSRFTEALEDDFNIPQALAVVWDLTKSELPSGVKLATLLDFDKVLGLKLNDPLEKPESLDIPTEAKSLIEERKLARLQKDWTKADEIRSTLENEFNIVIKDTSEGEIIQKR